MITESVLSKIIGTNHFSVIFQTIERQYFEKLTAKKSRDKAGFAREKL
jgi:hypothetical protein